MEAFYNYSEPFSAECRAFGRLQEAGHPELAVGCFGYLFLDEEHERAIQARYNLEFSGSGEAPDPEQRPRFLGRDGRQPPIRGIVKELGQSDGRLRAHGARRTLRDVIKLQQLGIIHIDVAHRQLINGKLADFSTAVTTPHYMTNPELNPYLTPNMIAAMEFEMFQFSIGDYWTFDDMIEEWNEECEDRGEPAEKLLISAFPNGQGLQGAYNLRSTPRRDRVYSFVDPRAYDWRAGAASHRKETTMGKKRSRTGRGGVAKTRRVGLKSRPPKWYYDCDSRVAAYIKRSTSFSTSLSWKYKGGLIFPTKKTWASDIRRCETRVIQIDR